MVNDIDKQATLEFGIWGSYGGV